MSAHPVAVTRRAGWNLARAARRVLAQSVLPRRRGFWLVVRLAPPLEELVQPLPIMREARQSLLEVLETLDAAGNDPRVRGVLLRFNGPIGGWSKLLSLRRAIERLRERGVPVAVYAELLEGEALVAASAADRLWLPVTGNLMLLGVRAEAYFLRGLLEHLHLQPEVVRIGSHKTAADRFTRDHMSPEERGQLEALVEDLYEQLVDAIARGRGLEPSTVRDLIDRGPYGAPAAVEAGLIDGCLYPDELERELDRLGPEPGDPSGSSAEERRVPLVEAHIYHLLRARDPGWRPLLVALPRIAYVVASGAIHHGSGPRGIASEPLRALLERLRRDERISSVVLRIDSPGGDGMASDLLWRSLVLVAREKPLVVSMGDVAASGGYYLASAADVVFAEAGTVTGSIGVVGGKLSLEKLYPRIGVGAESIERGARAGLLSPSRGFTADERAAVRESMSNVYTAFLDRVSQGRGLSPAALERVAEGRVWSGERARRIGLVDALGGPLDALREARRRAGLADERRVQLEVLPRRPSLPGARALLRLLPRRLELW